MRNPLDTCLSCYFQDFGGSHPWVYDLENIAYVYKEYSRIMNYWQNESGINMYNVKYEQLVQNQEKISRELINYIGLDWNEQCIQFHKNERFIWTASYDQVRQPMYKKSTARWKNYEQELTQLINALGSENT
jgi:LPS sulfotransferase NodH